MSTETQPFIDRHGMPALVRRCLDVLENDIAPLSRAGTAAGNKVFGAAVLAKCDLALVSAATNRETENPLWHGEVACINDYWASDSDTRPAPGECVFLSSHEPCSLCLSAIAWSGFDNFFYLFSYEDSRDAFDIPHDLAILEAVFDCPGGAYVASNAFWRSYGLAALVTSVGDTGERRQWAAQVERLRSLYAGFSRSYQSARGESGIPLA